MREIRKIKLSLLLSLFGAISVFSAQISNNNYETIAQQCWVCNKEILVIVLASILLGLIFGYFSATYIKLSNPYKKTLPFRQEPPIENSKEIMPQLINIGNICHSAIRGHDKNAAQLAENVLYELESSFNLSPLTVEPFVFSEGKIREYTNQYTFVERPEAGQMVEYIEPGWKYGNQIVKGRLAVQRKIASSENMQ